MPDQSSAATEHALLQEITAPLDRLPDDPVAAVNADFPAALRGYDRLAVDAYVKRTSQLVAELQATRSPEAAVRRALERVGEQISGILQRAHETAEQITAQSRREAEDRLEQVRTEAREIAAAAQQRVSDLDTDTDRIWIERHRIVDDARELARQLQALAQDAAERFPGADESTGPHAPVPDRRPYAQEEDTGPHAGDEGTGPSAGDEDAGGQAEEENPELEATVAFQPLAPDPQDEAATEPATATEPAPGPGPRSGSRSVIPPASQAANRRSFD